MKPKFGAEMVASWIVASIILMPGSGGIYAKDYGVHGRSFEISEEGFLAMVQRKLGQLDIKKHQQRMQDIAKQRIAEPVPVLGITRAQKARSFTFDPTCTLMEDARLPDGRVLYKAGTKVNPFDYMELDKKLVLIDGRDKEQVRWFKDEQAKGKIKLEDKLILVAGRPFDLEKELERAVYFDQSAVITDKLMIRQVPAIVQQQDKLLKIQEIVIN